MELDDKVCYCFHVSKRKILNYIRLHKPRRASQISQCGGAGTGCGWCVAYLERYFSDSQAKSPHPEPEMTPAQYAKMRAEYIDAGKRKRATGNETLPDDEVS
ncbi:(2Fe-2S)-binding protein [Rubinisphaera italica]|uniref:BFD-like [2Fe-2S] binding domain protein n=1 Tax=Rubinisphaera italica TaxID=2527969 RepID=A0A5C5XJ30_9PLAN|nr:(2Fe-2S)-binding protein [Rubinisphaera italica]TWT62351.1 BFD-like [2Fe-2S] binding domain protein [Rubinisphaera italica]